MTASPKPSEPSTEGLLFEGASAPPAGGDASGTARGLLYWVPVLVPLALFAQIAVLGLRPALSESARLDGAETRLLERYEGEAHEALALERILRAQRDPIYIERERRLLLAADGPLGVR